MGSKRGLRRPDGHDNVAKSSGLGGVFGLLVFTLSVLPGPAAAEVRRFVPKGTTAEQAVEASANRTLLVLAAGAYDPLAAAPDFSFLGTARASRGRYGIVQFHPGREAARAAISGNGVEFLGYLPHGAYQVRWTPSGRARLSAHPDVRWVGDIEPGAKISPRLWPGEAIEAGTYINVSTYPGGDLDAIVAVLERLFPGAKRVAYTPSSVQPRLRYQVSAAQHGDFMRRAAELDEVAWIEPWQLPVLHNASSVSPIQNNSTVGTPLWDEDLIGTGQIVGLADSGLDRNQCWFTQQNDGMSTNTQITDAEATTPPIAGTTHPDRKVLAYWVIPGGSAYDDNQTCPGGSPTSFHGTHTSGSVLGDRNNVATPSDPMFLSSDEDGMAPNAQLIFQDIGNDATGCLTGTVGNLALLFEQAHDGGARIHSNSWGAPTGGAYGSSDQEVDQAAWDLEDMIILFSAGNSGSGANTIGSPGNAKNVVTVGALGSGDSTSTAGFSSRGPTDDGRFKPDIQAPGTSVLSARGDNNDTTPACPTAASLSGTSMSTPTVAGGVALLRQYFSDGFYPTGARVAADAKSPTGALMKAVLLNGTRNLTNMPSFADGWGRVFLDNNLFFDNGDRRLRVWSKRNDVGLATMEMDTYTVDVPAGAEFRATLAWSDPPPALGAGVQQVNNLDLEVEGPGPTLWRGNVFSGGVSTTGGTADNLNSVEQVRLTAPAAGTYTIRVKGTTVPGTATSYTDRQGYGLAASFGNCAGAVSMTATGLSATPTPTAIDLSFTPPAGATVVNVYRADGDCTAEEASYDLVGTTAAGTFSDTTVQGGYEYAYRLRGADGCAEGPLSACVDVTSTTVCDLFPEFDETAVMAQTGGSALCANSLSWMAGNSSCPLGPAVSYNIYRSTTPYFTTGPGNLLTSGLATTTFDDETAVPLTTYFYTVRAEDTTSASGGPANNGNESAGSRWVKATTFSDMTLPGTFTDGADSPSFLILEDPWTVTNTQAFAGAFSYHNAPDGQNYAADTCAALTTPTILITAASPVLSYRARYNLEVTWDGVVTEISVNGGPWTDLPPTGGYPSNFGSTGSPPVNACGYAAAHGAFSGSSGGSFNAFSSTLPATIGDEVQIRWRMSSDPGAEEAGFFLDAVTLTNASTFPSCIPPLLSDGFESGDTSAWD